MNPINPLLTDYQTCRKHRCIVLLGDKCPFCREDEQRVERILERRLTDRTIVRRPEGKEAGTPAPSSFTERKRRDIAAGLLLAGAAILLAMLLTLLTWMTLENARLHHLEETLTKMGRS